MAFGVVDAAASAVARGTWHVVVAVGVAVVVSAQLKRAAFSIPLNVAEGYGKRSGVEEYRLQSRGGKGVINIKVSERNGKVVGMRPVFEEDEVIMISQNGIVVRVAVREIRTMGRATQGVRLIKLDAGDRLVSIARVAKDEDASEKS